ncbi:MAG: ATP-dependent 6-phosphofructokinase [Thermodesulfobacteriota bacterium]
MTKSKNSVEGCTEIQSLGPARIPNPVSFSKFVADGAKAEIPYSERAEDSLDETKRLKFELAGPREHVYFDTSKTKLAVVTCGGLCPGINDVIRAIVMEAYHSYKIVSAVGIRFGLEGFIPKYGHPIWEMYPDNVGDIHLFGGTVLGSSRGPQPSDEIVDALERMNINALFMIGGDGTLKAANRIHQEITKRKLKISVIGIPKTIDNDISFVFQSFGFDTAVEKATEAIQCAHTEATGAYNGIGMVKLMGRESGFIAAQATLALKEVNFVLVPESPVELDGPDGLLLALEKRLAKRKHAVIVVAEGAGQGLCDASGKKDASGNPVLGDICDILRTRIKEHFAARGIPHTLKFIDPSYIIRSVPANANDRIYCGFLGQHAVHAAMAGRTGLAISKMRGHYVHLPFSLVTGERRRIDLQSDYWRAVMGSTGQLTYRRKPEQDGSDAC